jgi:hypothetical protein
MPASHTEPRPAPPLPPQDFDPGARLIDRWPIHIAADDDETLRSWLRRASNRYRLSPHQIFSVLGITARARRDDLRATVHRHHEKFTIAFGVSLADFPVRTDLRSPWLADFSSSRHRFCPECLALDGYWRASWSAPLAIACPVHRILYADTCTHCGRHPWASNRWLGQIDASHICAASAPSKPSPDIISRAKRRSTEPSCGNDLRATPSTTACEDVLQAQAILTGVSASTALSTTAVETELTTAFRVDSEGARDTLAVLAGAAATRVRTEPATPELRAATVGLAFRAWKELTRTDQFHPHIDQLSAALDLKDTVASATTDTQLLYGPVIAAWHNRQNQS